MKKTVVLGLLLSTIISTSSYASAETNNLMIRRENIEAKATVRTEKREERKETIEANVTERAEKRQEHRSEVAANHAKRLASHFAAYYNRLNNLATKIQAKITEVKATGKDTSAAQTKLDAAKASLESAKTYGDQAVAAFQAIDPTKYDEQRDQALAARDLANKAREAFATALRNLKAAIEALKALRIEE